MWIAAISFGMILFLIFFAGNALIQYALVPKNGKTGRSKGREQERAGDSPHRQAVKAQWLKDHAPAEEWAAAAPRKTYTLTARDGVTLYADAILQQEGSGRWAIVVHGYTEAGGSAMLHLAHHYAKLGYQVLMPDLRCHGRSGGKFIGMGWPDRLDMLDWIGLLLREYGSGISIVLHGHSMGAATVMMTLGEATPPQLKAAVADCGYVSVWAISKQQFRAVFGLPAFPLLYAADLLHRLRGGTGLLGCSAAAQLKRSSTPILLIHGAEDDFVPLEMVYPLYEAAAGPKELLIVPEAAHADSKETDPVLYYGTVDTFLEKYV